MIIGKYNEDRTIYTAKQYLGKNPRTIHLGIDLFAPPGTKILCPVDGKVHSFQNNQGEGDYGPTIILEHNGFYTLYGHLTLSSIENLEIGQEFKAGFLITPVE